MNDASISVMFNITEGFLRRRNKETLQFLRYSFASNNESIARMLRRWEASLDDGVGTKNGPRPKPGPRI